MNDRVKKIIISVLIVSGLIFTVAGATFAYLGITTATNSTAISGATYKFDVDLDVTTIRDGKLIPVVDNLIIETLNSTHVCEDIRGYGLCGLYRIRLTNHGTQQVMAGVLETISSGFTASYFKYQLFTLNNDTYTAITDAASVSATAGTGNYFRKNKNDLTFTLADGTVTPSVQDIYLALWIHDAGTARTSENNKSYKGKVSFSSIRGDQVTAAFGGSDSVVTLVTFDPNGGTVPIDSKSVTVDHEYGPLPTPTRSGKTFVGWTRLPAGYTEYTYIANNSSAYIHTDIVPDDTTGVYAKVASSTLSTDKIFFGAGTATGNKRFWMGQTSANKFYYGWNTYTATASSLSKNTAYVIEMNYLNSRKVVVAGTERATNLGTLTSDISVGMNIFGFNSPDNQPSYIINGRMYVLRVSRGDEVIASFIPCKDTVNNKSGLYDLKSGTFYGSEVATDFTPNTAAYVTSSTIVDHPGNHTLTAVWK